MHAATVATYDRIAPAFAERWWSTRLEVAMARFVGALPADGPVADLGCGPGRDALWLASAQERDVVALDASAGMLAELVVRRQGEPVVVVQADLVALPLADGSLAGAWACASLLHLDRDATVLALAEMRRALRPGGALFASVQLGTDEVVKPSPEGDRFFTLWSADGLAAAVGGAGFAVDHVATEAGEAVSWVHVHAHRPEDTP